jgi:dihydrofolate synthase/folylpolyglutamate synthase
MDHFQQRLFQRINYERHVKAGTDHFKLQTMRELLKRLGQPQLHYPVIHVAGTKGKGSVSTMIARMLIASGKRVGVYTSPHLETIHQRIAIDGHSISNMQLEALLGQVFQVVDQMDHELTATQSCLASLVGSEQGVRPVNDPAQFCETAEFRPPTFFEIMTAASMLHFAQQQCEAVVLEVGLGGRLDSTNVCQPEIAVITNISLDHTRQLGSTLDRIAAEKAGIIKSGVPVVSGEVNPLAADVIADVAQRQGCPLFVLGKDFHVQSEIPTGFRCAGDLGKEFITDNLTLRMPGHHQRINAAIAVAVVEVLKQRGWRITDHSIKQGLSTAALAGRTEVICHQPTVLLDIAHNVASIEALLQTLKDDVVAWNSRGKKTLVFGTSTDKRYRAMLTRLLPEFDRVVFTKYQLNPRGRSADSLLDAGQEIVGKYGLATRLDVEPTPEDAWRRATQDAHSNDLICVAGSVFLIAELRATALAWTGSNDSDSKRG